MPPRETGRGATPSASKKLEFGPGSTQVGRIINDYSRLLGRELTATEKKGFIQQFQVLSQSRTLNEGSGSGQFIDATSFARQSLVWIFGKKAESIFRQVQATPQRQFQSVTRLNTEQHTQFLRQQQRAARGGKDKPGNAGGSQGTAGGFDPNAIGAGGSVNITNVTNFAPPAPPPSLTAKQKKNVLRNIQRQFPFNVKPYVREALQNATSMEEAALLAQELVIGSKEFKNAFPGIFRKDGTLRMDVGTYLATAEEYKDIARMHGFGLKKDEIGKLFSGEKSPSEFATEARAIQIFNNNPDAFKKLQQQIADFNQGRPAGQRIRQVSSPEDIVAFVAGQASRRVFDLFEAGQLQAAAERQGIDISPRRARQLARTTAGMETFEQAQEKLGVIGSLRRDFDEELRRFGVGQRQLENVAFGLAKNQGVLEKSIEQAQKQRQAGLQAEVTQAGGFDERAAL